MSIAHRKIAVFLALLVILSRAGTVSSCYAASSDGPLLNPRPETRNSPSELTVDSVFYLQKAISRFETDRDSQSVAVRVAPIVTVTTGLLDADVSPDEPLLRSSLQFLQRFCDDQKPLGRDATIPTGLLAKIETCLDKAHRNATVTIPDDPRHDSYDVRSRLLETLASLDDSDAVARAKFFAENLCHDNECDESETVTTLVGISETRYVVSPGIGRSSRIRDSGQAIAEFETLPRGDGFSRTRFDGLIADVHGLQNYPPLPDEPQLPKRETFFIALPHLVRSNDGRKKTTDEQVFACFIETYRSLRDAFEPYPLISRRYFLANNLAVLQTVRRLE